MPCRTRPSEEEEEEEEEDEEEKKRRRRRGKGGAWGVAYAERNGDARAFVEVTWIGIIPGM